MTTVRDIHLDGLGISSAISAYFMPEFITPLQVIRTLNEASIRFVLVGAYGLVGWTKTPRATQDVDVLVGVRGQKKAVRTLLAAFPHLQAEDLEVVTRLREIETQRLAIDVMKANQELFRAALKHTYSVEAEGESYKVPSLEMALTMKFAPMISLNRADEKKLIDASDFIVIVKSNPDIDLEKLSELGDLVYPGGGAEIVEKVRQVRAGKTLHL
jgi:hypothetical protein